MRPVAVVIVLPCEAGVPGTRGRPNHPTENDVGELEARSEIVKWMLCNDFTVKEIGEALPYLSELVIHGTTELKPPGPTVTLNS